MRRYFLLPLVFLAASHGAGFAAESTSAPSESGWREALTAELRTQYADQIGATDVTTRPAHAAATPTSSGAEFYDDDIMALDPITVRATWREPRLERLIDRRTAQLQATRLERALVHTVYERDFGKVHFGVVSVLGIPILAGLSW